MDSKIKNPRGAGRKPLNEKRKTLGVVLSLSMYDYVLSEAEKRFMTAPEYVRELIRKDIELKR